MGRKKITLKVCNDQVYFNPRFSIPIKQTNIPIDHMTFRTHMDIFWEVEMIDFEAEKKCLKVSVIEYNAYDITNFDNQEPKKLVNELLFDKFEWKKLEPLLTYHHLINLQKVLSNIETTPFSKGEKYADNYINFSTIKQPSFTTENNQEITNDQQVQLSPIITTVTDEFSVYFTDANFMLGYVSFKKRISKLNNEFDFKILNEHILAEFDNIKFWFAKKLKTKKFSVKASIKLSDNNVLETIATSEQISQITPELIDSVKYQRTFALTKEPQIKYPDKSIFTAEEIFTQINTEDIEGNVFNQSETDILNFFIDKSNIRNKKQLAYLSGKKHSEDYSLLYTLNPNFGFLFFIEGAKNNHFVWELLNSHATDIWSIEKGIQNVALQFKRIENIINTVRTNGRENYKRAYKNNHQDSDLAFRVINHKGISSKLIDEFPDWKSRLNEQLI